MKKLITRSLPVCLLALIMVFPSVMGLAQAGREPLSSYVEGVYAQLYAAGREDEVRIITDMEAYIAGGNTQNTPSDLSGFYHLYMRILSNHGMQDEGAQALAHYVALLEEEIYAKDISQLNPDERASLDEVPSQLIRMLGFSPGYDELLTGAMERLAGCFDSYKDKASSEADVLYDVYWPIYDISAHSLRVWVQVLRGQLDGAIADHEQYLATGEKRLSPEMLLQAEFFLNTELALFQGQPEAAAGYQEKRYLLNEAMSSESAAQYYHLMDMDCLYAFQIRGIVSDECILAYIDKLAVKTCFVLGTATEAGKSNGFMSGDKLYAINGERIYSPRQFEALLAASGASVEVELIRNDALTKISAKKVDSRLGFDYSAVVEYKVP